MAAPLKIFGTAFALTLGAWRLQLRVDLDEITDDAAASLDEAYGAPDPRSPVTASTIPRGVAARFR